MRPFSILLLLLAGLPLLMNAQHAKPDFSGRWQLDSTRTQAPAEVPEFEQVIEHKDPALKWTTTFKDANAGTMMAPFLMGIADPQGELRADGKEQVTKNGPFERRSQTVWDGQRLVTTWSVKTPQDPPQGKWARSLSADGKIQTIEVEFRSAMMGTLQAKLVLAKR